MFLTAQFTVKPVSVERAEGLEAVFRCQYQVGSTVAYDWFINHEIVRTDTKTVEHRPPSSPGEPATLTMLATPQHNNSVVQCLRNIYNGTLIVGSEESATAILTVYGELITFCAWALLSSIHYSNGHHCRSVCSKQHYRDMDCSTLHWVLCGHQQDNSGPHWNNGFRFCVRTG